MNKRPAIDFELLIPILIGGFSVVGILAVLVVGRLRNSPPEIPPTPSSTPFQYVYLGTEPAITTLVVDSSELPPTEEPGEVAPTMIEFTRRPSTPIILTQPGTNRTATPSRQPTVTRTSTASADNTYDDTHPRLDYSEDPGWISQTGVSGAYQGTLHISSAVGNSVTFTFAGTELHVFYQAGPSLGTITITIDNLGEPPISQAQSTTQIREWVSDTLSSGNHIVVIEHAGGGSVNVDRFFIPAPTPTPTRTPTP